MRLVKKSDIPYLMKIVEANYSKSDARTARREISATFTKMINKPIYIVALNCQEEIVGFAGFAPSWISDYIYEIFWVQVKRNFQRKGIGALIMKETIRMIKRIQNQSRTCVILLTTRSPQFYKKCKFRTILKFADNKKFVMCTLVN